jgi:hypothetical protein
MEAPRKQRDELMRRRKMIKLIPQKMLIEALLRLRDCHRGQDHVDNLRGQTEIGDSTH